MAAVSKQEYLKRYLSNSEGEKKKKKKKISKTASKRPTSIILDDDITLEDVKVEDGTKELTEFDVDADEAPAVYEDDGVTKISLEAFKKREEDQKTKWAPINQNTRSSPVRDVGQKSNYDSDNSLPRITNRRRQDTPDLSPQRGRFRDSPDQSPPRKRQGRSPASRQGGLRDSPDQSPPRKRQGRSPPTRQGGLRDSTDQSPPRKRQDRSPARRSGKELYSTCVQRREDDNSPPRSRRRHDSGDSLPEQVHINRLHSADRPTARRVRNDSPDLSPPRSPRKRTNSDSDQSPPRKGTNNDSDQSPPRKQNRSERGNSKSGSEREKRPGSEERMSSGQKAGLLSASDLKIENERKRARDAEMFSKMDPTVSGKGSETVYRDKMGRKKDIKMDRLKRREEERKEMEENEKFMEWGRGVTQTKQTQEKVADYLHEVDKPLARYRDDKDLDEMLKDKERDDDPMLAYMKQQKKKQDVKAGKKEKPVYKGPDPPPNRFNIRPGYRWDGVDRSNGFEKKRFAMLANKMATQSQAYKWSSEDL